MSKRLALLGASGHGKVVADAALAAGWQSVVFFDDAWPTSKANGRWPIVGNTADLLAGWREFDGVLVSIGSAMVRLGKQRELLEAGATIVTIVHPRACVSSFARIGAGTAVLAGAVVNADATVGEAGILNTCSSVDHDCVLADAVHVAPGAHLSGSVCVGEGAWIGIGASIRQCLHIGANVMVGAGAVVVSNVTAGLTVVGCPAAPLATR